MPGASPLCSGHVSGLLLGCAGDIAVPGYRDRAPPHFHAIYGEYHVTVEIETGLVDGRFPRRALQHVLEWHELHKQELRENWELSRNLKPLRPVAPLE